MEIEQHFYVFAVRHLDQWLAWEEVKFYAALLDFPTVPELKIQQPSDQHFLEKTVLNFVNQPSIFQSLDIHTDEACTMEGIVSRNADEYLVGNLKKNVFKYVRKNHVKTDAHWTRNWKRAPLKWEIS
ncbi:MAG: hypothetical protein ACJAT4_002472 [Granulosicoccus sp.]